MRQYALDHMDRKYIVATLRKRSGDCREKVIRRVDVNAFVDHRHHENGARSFTAKLRIIGSRRLACTACREHDDTHECDLRQRVHGAALGTAEPPTGVEATLIMRSINTFDSGPWVSSCLKSSTAARFLPCCI